MLWMLVSVMLLIISKHGPNISELAFFIWSRCGFIHHHSVARAISAWHSFTWVDHGAFQNTARFGRFWVLAPHFLLWPRFKQTVVCYSGVIGQFHLFHSPLCYYYRNMLFLWSSHFVFKLSHFKYCFRSTLMIICIFWMPNLFIKVNHLWICFQSSAWRLG